MTTQFQLINIIIIIIITIIIICDFFSADSQIGNREMSYSGLCFVFCIYLHFTNEREIHLPCFYLRSNIRNEVKDLWCILLVKRRMRQKNTTSLATD